MNFHRPWTIFALDAEHDAYGMARIAQAHNTCMSELASARAERDNACTALCPHGLDIAAKYENAKRELAAAKERIVKLEELLKEASNDWVPHSSNLSAAIVDLLHIPPPSPWRDRDD